MASRGTAVIESLVPSAIGVHEDSIYLITVPGTSQIDLDDFDTDNGSFMNLDRLYSYERRLDDKLRDASSGKVYLLCSSHDHHRSNAVVLIGAFLIATKAKTASEALEILDNRDLPLSPYRDAAFSVCTYHLPVYACLQAIQKATQLRHFNIHTFDVQEYMHLDSIENGDINWIIPNKFLAFSGPTSSRRILDSGKVTMSADDLVPIFRRLGVSCVIRFNKKLYNRRSFTEKGIKHIDLYYQDGSNPPSDILRKFLQVCEQTRGAIAVHCKAGLGRTGTNIAAYMMKHYSYTADEAIAWCRICRPGSIVGPQQHYVKDLEPRYAERVVKCPWVEYPGGFQTKMRGLLSTHTRELDDIGKDADPLQDCTASKTRSHRIVRRPTPQLASDATPAIKPNSKAFMPSDRNVRKMKRTTTTPQLEKEARGSERSDSDGHILSAEKDRGFPASTATEEPSTPSRRRSILQLRMQRRLPRDSSEFFLGSFS